MPHSPRPRRGCRMSDDDGIQAWAPIEVVEGLLKRAEQAEAAIARVRELHHPIPGFNGTQWCGAHCEATADGDPTEYPCETIRALDGAE